MNTTKPLWETLTFSGLQRIVMIVECVSDSNEYLSAGDRMTLINELINDGKPHTPSTVYSACVLMANSQLEGNIARASWGRQGGF